MIFLWFLKYFTIQCLPCNSISLAFIKKSAKFMFWLWWSLIIFLLFYWNRKCLSNYLLNNVSHFLKEHWAFDVPVFKSNVSSFLYCPDLHHWNGKSSRWNYVLCKVILIGLSCSLFETTLRFTLNKDTLIWKVTFENYFLKIQSERAF